MAAFFLPFILWISLKILWFLFCHIYFLFVCPESFFVSMILIPMYSTQHWFLLVCNTSILAMSSTSGNSENLADCGLQKDRSDFLESNLGVGRDTGCRVGSSSWGQCCKWEYHNQFLNRSKWKTKGTGNFELRRIRKRMQMDKTIRTKKRHFRSSLGN